MILNCTPGLLGEDGHVHAQLCEEAHHHAAHGERREDLAGEDLRVVGRLGAVAACTESVAPSGLFLPKRNVCIFSRPSIFMPENSPLR